MDLDKIANFTPLSGPNKGHNLATRFIPYNNVSGHLVLNGDFSVERIYRSV